jgi:uncharacterized RDD family membrane protein YckC
MNDPKPRKSVSVARKQLIAMLVLGILIVALTPAVPSLLARVHLGGGGFSTRTEWRILSIGAILVVGPAYALFRFRNPKD